MASSSRLEQPVEWFERVARPTGGEREAGRRELERGCAREPFAGFGHQRLQLVVDHAVGEEVVHQIDVEHAVVGALLGALAHTGDALLPRLDRALAVPLRPRTRGPGGRTRTGGRDRRASSASSSGSSRARLSARSRLVAGAVDREAVEGLDPERRRRRPRAWIARTTVSWMWPSKRMSGRLRHSRYSRNGVQPDAGDEPHPEAHAVAGGGEQRRGRRRSRRRTSLVGVDAEDPVAGREVEAAVARRGEVALPGFVRDDGAVLLGHRDRAVGRTGVDDDDLVDQAAERGQAGVETVGFVLDDDGGRQRHCTRSCEYRTRRTLPTVECFDLT